MKSNSWPSRVCLMTTAAACAVATAASPSWAAITEVSIATPDVSVTYSVPDVQFDGPECVRVPITMTYAKTAKNPSQTTARLQLDANQNGASNGIPGADSIAATDAVTGTSQRGAFSICRDRIDIARGPLNISGTLSSSVVGAATNSTPVPLGQIALLPNATTLTRPSGKFTSGLFRSLVIRGTATATTVTKGTIAAGGTLTLQIKKSPRAPWISGPTTRAGTFGEYTFTIYDPGTYPRGTQYRVSLTDCGWCANSVSATSKI